MSIFKKFTEKSDKKQKDEAPEEALALDESHSLVDETTYEIDGETKSDTSIEQKSETEAEAEAFETKIEADEESGFENGHNTIDLPKEPFLTESLGSFTSDDLSADITAAAAAIDVTDRTDEEPVFVKHEDEEDLGPSLEVSREPSNPVQRVNLGDMRLDVARINSDIESGEALYQRAQQRVQNLMAYVERAEVDFSLLNRLEPENRRLKSRKRALESEIETIKNRNSVLHSNLEEHKRRVSETSDALEIANAKLAKTMRALEDREVQVKSLEDKTSKVTLEFDRTRTDLEVESRENKSLRQKIAEMSGQVHDINVEKLDLAKSIESLKIDCDDQRKGRQKLQEENADLRYNLSQSEKQNNQMKNQLVAVHEEIKSFKTQYEFNILSRDDRIIALESKVAELSEKLKHKDNIVESAARDVSSLRRERTAAEMERQRLEKIIRDQSGKLTAVHDELLQSKQDLSAVDQRYKDVAAALQVSQEQRMATRPVPKPDIHPRMEEEDLGVPIINEDDDPATEIDDLLTEYKLGLRPNF